MDAAKMESAPRWNTIIKLCQEAADLMVLKFRPRTAAQKTAEIPDQKLFPNDGLVEPDFHTMSQK
jgi:hypothetical protein